MIFRFLVTAFILFSIGPVIAQDLPIPGSIQSPNAASLGKYGDVPISYYTGTPNISVPLYNLNLSGIPLDVSLNYNASGVRVNDMPGWVGQNWSLQAGGVITRAISPNGFADEYDTYSDPDEYLGWFKGYMYNESYSTLNANNWDSQDYIYNQLNHNDGGGSSSTAENPIRDYEPDIFTFNFMGHTGKFFMGHDGEWKVSSKSNLKIEINPNELEYPLGECRIPFGEDLGGSILGGCFPTSNGVLAYKAIYKISVVDDKGTTYIFGNTDNSVEYDTNLFYNWNFWIANAWYLTKVIDKYDNVVYEFEYEREEKYSATFYESMREGGGQLKEKDGGWVSVPCSISDRYGSILHPYHGRLISSVYLKEIRTDLGAITFNSSVPWAKTYMDDDLLVSEIRHNDYRGLPIGANRQLYLLPEVVFGTDAEFKALFKWRALRTISGFSKSVTLNYNEDYLSGVKKRLNLLSVQVNDKTYSFEYNDIDALPKYLSRQRDHWGYYNGTITNEEPNYRFNNPTAYYNSRNTHPENVKKGMLTKLIYPTGGWTEFEWEANRYNSYVSDDKSELVNNATTTYAGGVRISKITDKPSATGDSIIREFEYSQGILNAKPKYKWSDYTTENNDYIFYGSLTSTNPIIPLVNSSGTHIGYSNVTESYSDGSSIEYNFTSNEDAFLRDEYHFYPNNAQPNPYTHYSDKSLLRGHLKEKIVRDSNDNIKQTTNYHYTYDNNKYARGVKKRYIECSHGGGLQYTYAYKLFYYDYNVIEELSTDVLSNGSFVNKTEFNWGSFLTNSKDIGDNFLKSKTTNVFDLSEGSKEIIEYYDYPFDFSDQTYQDMKDKRMLDLVRTNIYLNTKKVSEKKLTYISENNNIYPEILWTANKGNSLDEDLIYHSFDFKGQPTEISTPDGIHTIYVYGYNDSYVIAKIEGASYSDLSTAQSDAITDAKSLSDYDLSSASPFSENLLRDKLNLLRNAFPNAMVTSYTYATEIGVTSIIDPKGYTVFYKYDAFNRLESIKDADGNLINENEYNYKN